jgi:Domain of unknown function (DUF4158)
VPEISGSREEIPDVVAGHVRRCLELGLDVDPDHGAARTARLRRKQVRARQGVKYDMRRGRAIVAAEIRKAAQSRNHPPDLVNVALEKLLEASLELPGFSTLDEMATRIRAEVNSREIRGPKFELLVSRLRLRPPEVPCAKRAGFAQRCRSSTGRKFPAMEPSKRFFVMEHPWMKNFDVTHR